MLHLMKCRCTQLLRGNDIFWSLLFPMILGTMFHFAFGNLATTTLEPIPVAIVVNEVNEQSEQFENFTREATDILAAETMDKKEALSQLEAGNIDGIFETGSEHKLTVTTSNLNTSILQSVLQTYQMNENIILEIAKTCPENLQEAWNELSNYKNTTEQKDIGGNKQDRAMPYFFALIGMACMYGCFLGMRCAIDMQANLSALGARRSVTPTHRLKLIIADMITTFALHFICVILVLIYLQLVLGINLGNRPGETLLVSAVGSMIGVALGIFVGSLGKIGENAKVAITLSTSMVCSFFAGLMVGTIKDIIEQHAPIINRLNPAALISDAFYSLSIYYDMERYYKNVLILFGMSVLLIGLSFWQVRRERYDSI